MSEGGGGWRRAGFGELKGCVAVPGEDEAKKEGCRKLRIYFLVILKNRVKMEVPVKLKWE